MPDNSPIPSSGFTITPLSVDFGGALTNPRHGELRSLNRLTSGIDPHATSTSGFELRLGGGSWQSNLGAQSFQGGIQRINFGGGAIQWGITESSKPPSFSKGLLSLHGNIAATFKIGWDKESPLSQPALAYSLTQKLIAVLEAKPGDATMLNLTLDLISMELGGLPSLGISLLRQFWGIYGPTISAITDWIITGYSKGVIEPIRNFWIYPPLEWKTDSARGGIWYDFSPEGIKKSIEAERQTQQKQIKEFGQGLLQKGLFADWLIFQDLIAQHNAQTASQSSTSSPTANPLEATPAAFVLYLLLKGLSDPAWLENRVARIRTMTFQTDLPKSFGFDSSLPLMYEVFFDKKKKRASKEQMGSETWDQTIF